MQEVQSKGNHEVILGNILMSKSALSVVAIYLGFIFFASCG